MPVLNMPNDPADKATKTEVRIWEKEVDEHVKRKTHLQENIKTPCSLAWGQCTEAIRARIEALDTWCDDVTSEGQSLELLKASKAVVSNFQSQKHQPRALHHAKPRFHLLSQDKHLTCQSHLERFHNCVDVVEHCGESLGQDAGVIKRILKKDGKDVSAATTDKMDEAGKIAQEQHLATAVILCSD
jgi:hypothetical protein